MAARDQTASDSPPSNQLRFELWLTLGLLLFGLMILPALVYLVGISLLGSYGGGGRLGAFYGDLIRDLMSGSARAWLLILGPLLLVQLGRLIFFRFGAHTDEAESPQSQPKLKPATGGGSSSPQKNIRERREPTIKF